MAEYIERGHLLAAFSLQDYPWVDVDDYYEIAMRLPAVDAVEVVRCKDCKYWDFGDCFRQELTRPDDFCSYGERKDNG